MNFLMDLFSTVFGFLYEVLFGCRHHRLTRPFTIEAETYKVCLDCGRQIYYSTERMMPLTTRELRRMRILQSQTGVVRLMPSTSAERKLITERARKSTAAA